jgi:hypothetical protein
MAYGILKVDNITFDNGGSDQNVTVSGLYRATTSGVTVSGTIVAATVSGVTIIGSTTVSGATVTGTTANFTSGNFSNIISSAATMSGALIMANQQQVRFREAVGNGVNHIALQAPAIVSADQTITLPDQTGTVVTTGDNGSVTSTMILDGTILNADINASAAIAGTKISPDFGSQTIVTTGVHSAAAGSATTPSIAFTGDLNTGIYSPGADQLAVSTGGTGRLFVDASGNVGIGTTSPSEKLHVAGIILGDSNDNYFGSYSSGGAYLDIGSLATSAAWLDARSTSLTNVPVNIRAKGTGEIIFHQTSGEKVRIDSSGNVGIGTSTPTFKLMVAAPAGAQPIFLAGQSGVSNGYEINSTGSALTHTWSTAGGEKVRITDAGNVGIGTSSPSQKLHVSGGDTTNVGFNGTTKGVRFDFDGTQASIFGVDNTFFASYQPLRIGGSITQFMYGGTEAARIDSSGRVGIGTSSPSADLHVAGTSILFRGGAGTVSRSLELGSVASAGGTSTSDILLATYGGNNGSRIRGTGSYNFNAGTAITFGTSPTSGGGIVDRVTINSAGNVGIGTTSPTTLLDVNTDTVRVRTARTPASASATGATGEICWDANYIYVCTATNTWKRSALSTW